MEVERAIYRRLTVKPGDAEVDGLVDSLRAVIGDAIYPNEADPDAPRPLAVYNVVGKNPIRELSGRIRYEFATVNIAVEADTLTEVKAIDSAIYNLLDGGEGATFDGVERCQRVDYQTQDTDDGGSESLQTFQVWQ